MRIRYVGPLPGVRLPNGQTVTRTDVINVDADLGRALLDQPDAWQPAKRQPTPSDPTPATTEES